MNRYHDPVLVEWAEAGNAIVLRTAPAPDTFGRPTQTVYPLGKVWRAAAGTWFAQLSGGEFHEGIPTQDVAQRCLLSMARDQEPLIDLIFDPDNWRSIRQDRAEMRSITAQWRIP